MATHFHSHDNSTHIKYPDTIKVHEHKAPTDESVRLLNEMQEKTVQNLIAKVDVKNNLVEGTVHCFENLYTSMQDMVTLIFKFKINGQEFVVEKKMSRDELYKEEKDIREIQRVIGDYAKSVMLWYALKKFAAIAYEQITEQPLPEYLLK